MPLEDKRTRRTVEREVSKFPIDPTLLSITVINKVCTFRGRVKPLRGPVGRGVDIRTEMHKVEDAVMTLPDIQQVVLDVTYDSR